MRGQETPLDGSAECEASEAATNRQEEGGSEPRVTVVP